jgi:hypothetical protein
MAVAFGCPQIFAFLMTTAAESFAGFTGSPLAAKAMKTETRAAAFFMVVPL